MALRELTPLRIVPSRAPADGRATVEIYRPFFLAGIISVLTVGCLLGAVALVGIAQRTSYTATAWTPYVLAHANSQLYGWVGLFVMGFALQQHAPRSSQVRLFHRLAFASLSLMAVGIVIRFVAEPMVDSNPEIWRPVGVFSALLQLAAVALFMVNTTVTRFRTNEDSPWQSTLVFASLTWWFIVAAAEPVFFYQAHQIDHVKGILFVAKWFPPYRDAQFLGFVTMMIFGVALVKMNSCFGAKPASKDLAISAFIVWNFGLIVRMFGWVHYFDSGMEAGENRYYFLGGVFLAIAACMLVGSTRMFEKLNASRQSHKFIKGAFVWLILGGLLFVLEPIHLRQIDAPFSHAYIGAIRHALTVGFISQMILGVGMHVSARMNDLPDEAQKSLWSVFWLVNLGNGLRVSCELASDYTKSAFGLMGVSGFIELVGLAIWAYYVSGLMLRNGKVARAA